MKAPRRFPPGRPLSFALASFISSLAHAQSASEPAEPATSQAPKGLIVQDTLVVDVLLNPGLIIAAEPGFGAGVRVGSRDHRFMLGLSFQAGRLPQFAEDIFFDTSLDGDDLTVDWDYAISLEASVDVFRFSGNQTLGGGSIYGQLGLGYETWRLQSGGNTADVFNSFASAAVGVMWRPIAALPVFVQVQFTGILLFGQEDSYMLGEDAVELNTFAFNPGLWLGYRFD